MHNYSKIIKLCYALFKGYVALDVIDFQNLSLGIMPTYYLVCPKNYCNKKPHVFSPDYPVKISVLELAWEKMVASQPRTQLTFSNREEHKYQYIQYSRIWKYPDYIDVQFIAKMPDFSTLAICSRSRYGFFDFGVNKARITAWLKILPHFIT